MKSLMLTLKLLCAADAGTSHIILATGGREVVYPIQNPYVLDAVIAGQCTAASTLQKGETTHPKLSKGMVIGLVVLRATAVGFNTVALAQR